MNPERFQDISELIESKTRLLEHDAKNLDFGKDDDDEDEEPERVTERVAEKTSAKKPGVKPTSAKNRASGAGHGHDRDHREAENWNSVTTLDRLDYFQ